MSKIHGTNGTNLNHFAKRPDKIGASPTPEQSDTLEFIRRYSIVHKRTPTFQEMADEAGISKVSIYSRVVGLARRGLVLHRPNVERGIVLVGRCECCGSIIPTPQGFPRSPETRSEPRNSARKSRSSAT